MSLLQGNLLVAQSGGPTAVINASVAGVIQAAGKIEGIDEIYGGLNGILGILNEELIDLNEEKARTIEGLKYTPAAALGTCRYKIDFKKKPEQAAKDLERLFQVFQAHNIRYFFYIGGNDSQDTACKIHQRAQETGYEMRVIGIPKTIDNDLPCTDFCPGYGSVIKYNATTVMEISTDVSGMASDAGMCCIIEVMGRSAGWIAAGAALAKRAHDDPPHIILLPEVPFDEEAFLTRVKDVITKHKYCIVVVGEGLKNSAGAEIAAHKGRVDAFGHFLLSGVASYLEDIVFDRLGVNSRSVKLGYAQRSAGHLASATDVHGAVSCGEAAVQAAAQGRSGAMVKLVRTDSGFTTALHDLTEIANEIRTVPRDWINDGGFMPNQRFIDYARPLILGEVKPPLENGLPRYAVLDKVRVEKKLPPAGTI
jgi:6-phosphofructokinase 1